jgi:hypothetical protein
MSGVVSWGRHRASSIWTRSSAPSGRPSTSAGSTPPSSTIGWACDRSKPWAAPSSRCRCFSREQVDATVSPALDHGLDRALMAFSLWVGMGIGTDRSGPRSVRTIIRPVRRVTSGQARPPNAVFCPVSARCPTWFARTRPRPTRSARGRYRGPFSRAPRCEEFVKTMTHFVANRCHTPCRAQFAAQASK